MRRGEIPIIGVNTLQEEGRLEYEPLRVDPEVRRRVMERLEEYRRQRDQAKVKHLLSKLAEEAERLDVNLFPTVLECVRAGTTLGEISGTLRDVWGEWHPEF